MRWTECWSLAPLWRTRRRVWGWMVFWCCSSSGLIGWLCSPAQDAWHDGFSAQWRPRASLHVHTVRVSLLLGMSAPLWKWGGLEDRSVEQTEGKTLLNTVWRIKRVSKIVWPLRNLKQEVHEAAVSFHLILQLMQQDQWRQCKSSALYRTKHTIVNKLTRAQNLQI